MKYFSFFILTAMLMVSCGKRTDYETTSEDSVYEEYFSWEKEERTEEEWQEWADSLNSTAEQIKELINKGIIHE